MRIVKQKHQIIEYFNVELDGEMYFVKRVNVNEKGIIDYEIVMDIGNVRRSRVIKAIEESIEEPEYTVGKANNGKT